MAQKYFFGYINWNGKIQPYKRRAMERQEPVPLCEWEITEKQYLLRLAVLEEKYPYNPPTTG